MDSEENQKVNDLALLGLLVIIIGVIGVIVLLKGRKKPQT